MSTGTAGLAVQLKCSNRLCLGTQPRADAATWETETLTAEGELHDEDAPCLVPEEALPFVASLQTQEEQRSEEGGRWDETGTRERKERQDIKKNKKVTNFIRVKILQLRDIHYLIFFNTLGRHFSSFL